MRTMKAVTIHKYGDPSEFIYENVPCPEPGEDEVLIRVHATSVNRIDAILRAGYATGWFNLNFPAILGCDVSGTVEAVGSKVTDFKAGDAVYARTQVGRPGTYAEYVVVLASEVALKPRSLDHIHAAAVPHAALTSWQTLFDAGNLGHGQTVLVHAAAGGVGHMAVQLAKWRGARVIGTASTHNHDFLRELGADQLIDYNHERFEEAVQAVDMVMDTMGGDTLERSWATLKRGGVLASLLEPPSAEKAEAYGVRSHMVGALANAAQLAEIASLIDAGHLKPTVSKVLPLTEVSRAHELIETGRTRGKIVLQVID